MAIQPLDQRLSGILPAAEEAAPELQDSPLVPPETEQAILEPTQVAVLGSGLRFLAKEGDKLIQSGKKAAEIVDAVPPSAAPPVPPSPAAVKPAPVKAPAAPKKPTPAPAANAPEQLQKFEEALPTAQATGTPPDTLINLDRIDGPEDFKKTVDALATATGVKVERVSFEQLIADAKAKGLGQDLIMDLDAMRKQYGELPTDVVSLRLASYQSAQDFYKLAREAYLKPDDKDLMAQMLNMISKHAAITDTYVGVRTRAAQATAAGNIQITKGKAAGIFDGTENVRVPGVNDAEMKAMLDDPEVAPNLKILVEKFVQLTDDGAREGLLNKVSKVGIIKDLWDRTWKNGLLSGTGTHIVNLSSNTTFLASSVATRAIAGAIGTGKRAVGLNAEVELGEAGAMVAGMISAFREGMGLGWTALKTGTTREMREGLDVLSDAGQKLEGQYQIFDAKDYGFENETLIKGINAYANFVTLLGGRPIMGMDEVFKTMGYRAELYAQAFRAQKQANRAALEAGADAGEAELQGLSRMAEILGDPPKEIDDAANDYAQMITFSRQLTGSYAKIQELSQDHLVGRIILPFVKTPTWVASESVQHSLFAPLSKQWKQDYNAGGAKRELAVAKWGMGSVLMIGVSSYVADGRITGGGPGDTNLRNIYMASGWRPYSFVFQKDEWDEEFAGYLRGLKIDPSVGKDGKLYVPFRGIDPIAGPMAMMADAVEYARYEDDQDMVAQVMIGSLWGLYSYVGQQPFLQGISSIAGAFSQTIPNPKAAFRNALDSIVSAGTQYAIEGSPVGVFSSARAMIERGTDNVKRMTAESPNLQTGIKGFYEGLNKVLGKTPFLSDSLPEQYDYLGEVMTDVDPANPWLASTSGIRFSNDKQRPADKAMIQLGMSIKKPDMAINMNSVSVKLEVEEYAYMMRQLGMVTDGDGNTLKDAIAEKFKSPAFQMLDKDDRQIEMRDLYGSFVKAAQAELVENSKFSTSIQMRLEAATNRQPRLGIYNK